MTRLLPALLIALALGACGGGARQPADRAARNVLSEQEIRAMDEMSAHEAISRARPEYLRSRGNRSLRTTPGDEYPVVYVDQTRMGSIDVLHSIRTATIREIRFLGGPDATTRYGTGHGSGVILIITR
jgi:hypothetical protein